MDKRYIVERAARELTRDLRDLRGLRVGSRIGTYDALARRLHIKRGWVRDVLLLVKRDGYIELPPHRQAVLVKKPAPLPATPPKPIELARQRLAMARELILALPDTPQRALDSQIALLATTFETGFEVVKQLATDAAFDWSVPQFKLP